MSYNKYRFKLVRFQDGTTISRISMPIVAISPESAIADIEEAYRQKVLSWSLYV